MKYLNISKKKKQTEHSPSPSPEPDPGSVKRQETQNRLLNTHTLLHHVAVCKGSFYDPVHQNDGQQESRTTSGVRMWLAELSIKARSSGKQLAWHLLTPLK